MNTIPMLKGQQVRKDDSGSQAMRNVEVAFWQSRMTVAGKRAEPPQIVDLYQLARDVRRAQ